MIDDRKWLTEKPTEVRAGQVWRDLDPRTAVPRYIVVTRLTGHVGFYAARCSPDGHMPGIERYYWTEAFLRRANTRSGFALVKDSTP